MTNQIDFIGRVKLNNWKYNYNDQFYTMGQLIRKMCTTKNRRRSRVLNMYTTTTVVEFKGNKLRVFFYKDLKRGSKWNVIVSTDLKLTAIRAYKIYKNRWTIEVSYKELKQHIGYGKCQSRDFCGQIADATIALMTYNALAHYKAIHNYESIGGVFEHTVQSWITPNLMQRFWNELYGALKALADTIDKSTDWLLNEFTHNSEFFKNILFLSRQLTSKT